MGTYYLTIMFFVRLIHGGSESEINGNEPRGTCEMHTVSLALGLSLSTVKRTVNKKVVNYWAPFQLLDKKAKASANYLFDKKNKRYPAYKAANAKINKETYVVNLPGGTRVGEKMLLYQDLLRSMHAMRYFATVSEDYEKISHSRAEWRQIAQFESVTRRALQLCFATQGNRPEIAAEMPLVIAELKFEYRFAPTYDVVDVDADAWEATTPFQELPRIEMTSCAEKARSDNLW